MGGCPACCETDFSGGAQFLRLAELDCVCSGSGSCAAVCSAEECAVLSSRTAACDNCIQQRLASVCGTQAASACAKDPSCKLYAQCQSGCP